MPVVPITVVPGGNFSCKGLIQVPAAQLRTTVAVKQLIPGQVMYLIWCFWQRQPHSHLGRTRIAPRNCGQNLLFGVGGQETVEVVISCHMVARLKTSQPLRNECQSTDCRFVLPPANSSADLFPLICALLHSPRSLQYLPSQDVLQKVLLSSTEDVQVAAVHSRSSRI